MMVRIESPSDELGHLVGILGEHDHGIRVLGDVLALVRQVGGVDRDGDAAGAEDAHVHEHPLERRVAQDGNAITRGHTGGDEAA
jgi:hypothetical protein